MAFARKAAVCRAALGGALLLTFAQMANAESGAATLVVPPGGTMGLLASGWRYAIHETPDMSECPQGVNAKQYDQYKEQFPNEEARAAWEMQHGYYYGNRGPNGENVFYHPATAVDPIPFKESLSAIAPGIDLDGKTDKEDFVSADGRKGIDNQLNRILGCIEGIRTNGYIYAFGYRAVRTFGHNRIMFEISGIDSMTNDPQVKVRVYRGLDPVNVSGADEPAPGGTQRIDYERGRRYMNETTGRIVDGVLITDAIDQRLPWQGRQILGLEYQIKRMQLRVKLTPNGGQGIIGGFFDTEQWFRTFSKNNGAGAVADTANWSPSGLYQAMLKNADAYPDADGKMTGISMALAADFVWVHIQHKPNEPKVQLAQQN